MKIRSIFESTLAGIISAIFSYRTLRVPAILAALAMRRKMPDAWFAGLIVWYVVFFIVAVSIIVGAVACRIVYKHAASKV